MIRRSTQAGALALAFIGLLVAAALATGPTALVLIGAGGLAFALCAARFEPAALLSLAIAGAMFSGFGTYIGLPISPDRPLFALALGAAITGLPFGDDDRPRLRWRPVHTWMIATVLMVIALGMTNDSWSVDVAIFALLDRLGIVPFLAFSIAPLLFRDDRRRAWLSGVMVGCGWYLSITAILEGFGLRSMVWPAYINDPTVGLHFERARGPFVESTGMGLSLLGCYACAVVAVFTWKRTGLRILAALLLPAALLGMLFTLTRAVWLAAVVSSAVGILMHPRARRYTLHLGLAGVMVILLALVTVPGLSDAVTERRNERVAVWDRFNSNEAAIQAFADKPLTGIGWGLFAKRSDPYLWQSDNYPLTGHRIEVHNVLLSRLAEIGLLGTVPWLLTLAVGLGRAVLRPSTAALEPWRLGLAMFGSAWATMGAFGPISTALPNLLLWTMGGVVSAPYLVRASRTAMAATSPPRRAERRPIGAGAPGPAPLPAGVTP